MTQKNITTKDRLIFALDVPDCEVAKNLVQELGDSVNFYKLGLELMMTGDYFDLLDWMLSKEKKVFVDLKFFDIPATVGAAVHRLKNRGTEFEKIKWSFHKFNLFEKKFDQAIDINALHDGSLLFTKLITHEKLLETLILETNNNPEILCPKTLDFRKYFYHLIT